MSANPAPGLTEWLALNERVTAPRPVVTSEWKPILGRFAHLCEFADWTPVDEFSDAIIHCRCFHSRAFLDAQDRRAVEMDAKRVPQE